MKSIVAHLWNGVAIVPSAFMVLLVVSEFIKGAMPVEGVIIWVAASVSMTAYLLIASPFRPMPIHGEGKGGLQ